MGAAKWSDMNQFERADARMKVEAYRAVRRPGETDRQRFDREKAEALAELDKQRAQVECMTFEDMFPRAPRDTTAPQSGADGREG